MSSANVHPPQTYSRLFRPWDNTKSAANCSKEKPILESVVKREYHQVMDIPEEKDEQISFSGNTSDSERECASSNSYKSSFEDGLNNSLLGSSQLSPQPGSNLLSSHHQATSNHFYHHPSQNATPSHSHHHHQVPFLNGVSTTASDLYYAAAAAAVNGLPSSNPASVPSSFGVDPYTFGLMEQEYARIMAEEAQMKALNARKQRPKKFKCPHCDVAFSNNGQLKGHIRIHTGERPFKCDVENCGKTFTRNEELTRHKRIHTGIRPYPCSVCGKKFGRRDHLKKHMKTHMPQERHLGPAIFVPMYPYLYGY